PSLFFRGSITAGKVEMGNSAECRKQDQVGPDTLLRLKDAVSIAFPMGGMTVSGLRKERNRGRLAVEKIAGREFTTLRNIEQMRAQCREAQKVQGFGSNQTNGLGTENFCGALPGSLETDRARSARAALQTTAQGLSKRSRNTLARSTKPPANTDVTPLKS